MSSLTGKTQTRQPLKRKGSAFILLCVFPRHQFPSRGSRATGPLSLQGQSMWPWDAVVRLAVRRGHGLELSERQRESAKPASPRVQAPEQGLGWDSWGYFSKGQTTVPGEEGKRTGEREGRSRRPLCVKAVSRGRFPGIWCAWKLSSRGLRPGLCVCGSPPRCWGAHYSTPCNPGSV